MRKYIFGVAAQITDKISTRNETFYVIAWTGAEALAIVNKPEATVVSQSAPLSVHWGERPDV